MGSGRSRVARTHAHSRTDYWCDCCHGHGVLPRALDWSSPSFVTLSSDSQSCHELAIERQPARLYAKLLRLFISSWQLQEWFVIASGASGKRPSHSTTQSRATRISTKRPGPNVSARAPLDGAKTPPHAARHVRPQTSPTPQAPLQCGAAGCTWPHARTGTAPPI